MRLTQEKINTLKLSLAHIDTSAKIFLFGSRLDDTKKGDDIDLLITSSKVSKSDVRKLRMAFYQNFGEQKMDILIDDGKMNSPFLAKVREQAIEL
ncbi:MULTISPECIES: nucleotidyltransferase domain-containing protein [Methylomonas]|uniref:DNA polymerase III subunit beta n=2 Tax=Methylomonas TaxID=416 RepID=A0A140E5L9_9GAMM|nr:MULTISPECIES: nucleotidyltransferase domain-containing protein [Methylomonas]AMK78693.1 DNA polymerase III subunit beta [Methylomonas denitrificans]OAI03689.1 DNA polymerase III subunit beta [Methylomonas methanica]TCV83555.1 nucleotidyltransferase-like protein [Methylomonas methanica]